MSIFKTYLQKEQQLKKLQEELDELKKDERLQTELDFKNHLDTLMHEFNQSVDDVIKILDPSQSPGKNSGSDKGTRRSKRKLKIYQNPHTSEIVETRGGNQKTLKAWKDEYGAETVEGWLIRTKD